MEGGAASGKKYGLDEFSNDHINENLAKIRQSLRPVGKKTAGAAGIREERAGARDVQFQEDNVLKVLLLKSIVVCFYLYFY